MSANSEEVFERDEDMSSWSSAFAPVKKRHSTTQERRRCDKEETKKRKKKERKSASVPEDADNRAEQLPSSSYTARDPQEQEGSAHEGLPANLGRWVFHASWEPTEEGDQPEAPPKRSPGRAAAKMLVRAGLRCKCHFALDCQCSDVQGWESFLREQDAPSQKPMMFMLLEPVQELSVFTFVSPSVSQWCRRDDSDSSDSEEMIPTIYGLMPMRRKAKKNRKHKKSKESKRDRRTKKKASKKRAPKAKKSSYSSESSSSSSSPERRRHKRKERAEAAPSSHKGESYHTPSFTKDHSFGSGKWGGQSSGWKQPGWHSNKQWQAKSWQPRGSGKPWNTWTAHEKGYQWKLPEQEEEAEDREEASMQEALMKSAMEEAWSDRTRTLSYSELPADQRGPPYKEVMENVEADDIERMAARIKEHSRLPEAMINYVSRFLASLPDGTLPQELKWAQHSGSHFSASILELELKPDIAAPEQLQIPDPVHSQSLTAAHGTKWSSAHGILSQKIIRPQAAQTDQYPPYGFFARGSCEQYSSHTAMKALEGVARKAKASGSGIAILVSARAHAVQLLEGGRAEEPLLDHEVELLDLERLAELEDPGELDQWPEQERPEATLALTPAESELFSASASARPQNQQSSPSGVLQGREYEQALQGCLLRAAKRPRIVMPWETPLMRDIFGTTEPPVVVPQAQLQTTAPPSEPDRDPGEAIGKILMPPRAGASSALSAVKNRPNVNFPKSEQASRLKGISLWCDVIGVAPQHFGITRHVQLSDEDNGGQVATELFTCVDAVMGVKAPSTINSRGMVVKRYLYWCTQNDRLAWPMKEAVSFDYVHHLKALGAPTAPASFLQAVNFMIYTIEPEGATAIISSFLIQGVAKQASSKKRPLKQAPALTVAMVLRLHAILRNTSEGVFDRLAAGLMLMCVYGRCRCSDLRHIEEICLDITGRHGFIEVRTEHHKTANREKRRLLPIVAPAFGVTDENWAEQFLTLRKQVLGEFAPGPFLPAPLSDDSFSERSLESDEFTSLLRYLLRQLDNVEDLTSHSCKETVLAWMARFGADKPTLEFLGRHVGSITSSDVYARGMQSRPLRKLAMALNAIRAGTFLPDETRSGLFRSRQDSRPIETGINSRGEPSDTTSAWKVVSNEEERSPASPDRDQETASLPSAAPAPVSEEEANSGAEVPKPQIMTSLLDSEAQFLQRAAELGIPDAAAQAFKRHGLATLNRYGFAHGQPGQPIDETLFNTFFEGIAGVGQSLRTLSAARNLLFEAHVFISASLKNRVEATADTAKPVPRAERSARLDSLRAKYPGLEISKGLEPGHAMLDSASHQAESKILKYMPPSRCASREQEMMSNKSSAKLLEIEGSQVKVKENDKGLFIENNTEFLVYQALRRRGLAYEFADLVTFTVHQKWVDWLFGELSKEQPARFQKVQMFQILRADKAAWLHMADVVKDIRPSDGTRPIDAEFARLPTVHSVVFALLPLQQFSPKGGDQKGDRAGKGKNGKGWKGNRPSPYDMPHQDTWFSRKGGKDRNSKGKSKGKGKGKHQQDNYEAPRMPKLLLGLHYKCPTSGRPICFGHNLPGGCPAGKNNESECDRGKVFQSCFALELFAGTAGITAAMKSVGLLDLSLEASQHLVFQILSSDQLVFVWMAPPCGTCSRAREIAMSTSRYGPRPLRSDDFPDGLPHLLDHEAERVKKANELYKLVTQVCIRCTDKQLPWTVENPFSSLFWRTSFWTEAQSRCNPRYVQFHSCMYGSDRKKNTALAFFGKVPLDRLHAECDNSHAHKSWGWSHEDQTFSTSLESAYPAKLCKQVAHAVKDACEADNFVMEPLDMLRASQLPLAAEKVSRAMASEGTTKSNLPNFVPEYRVILKAFIPRSSCTWRIKDFIEHPLITPQVTIPDGSRLLEISPRTEGENSTIPAEADTICTFGVPWSPGEFLKEAAGRGHPADAISTVPEPLKRSIWELAADDPSAVAERRASFFRKWMSVASELYEEEKALKDSMDEGVRSVVKDKKILLFKEMVNAYELNDAEAHKLLEEGVDLTGEIPMSNDLPKRYTPATIHESELEALAPVLKDAALSRALGAAEGLSKEVWEKTITEVSRGWLKGPMEPDDADAPSVVSNRFGVKQRDKVRCVDDMSASLINATTFAEERISLHSVDVMASAVVEWCDARDAAQRPRDLTAKSFDLKWAFKQMAVSASSRDRAGLVIKDPSGCPKVFTSLALPFGATQSVYAFNRMSRALWTLGVVALSLMWTVFFDDFCLFSEPALEKSSDLAARSLFDILGWVYDTSGEKNTVFGRTLHALGVSVNLRHLTKGSLLISNTEARISELVSELSNILDRGRISRSEARHMAGRMSFAGGQIFGRLPKSCLKVFYSVLERNSTAIDGSISAALRMYIDIAQFAPARTILLGQRPCVFIYTDASLEPTKEGNVAGIGGVLCGPTGEPLRFFSYFPSSAELAEVGIDLESKCIFLLELAAVCLAFKAWGEALRGMRVVCYCDNEGAKACLMTGASANRVANDLLKHQAAYELKTGIEALPDFPDAVRSTDGDFVIPTWKKRERSAWKIFD
ncbi:unnamed protein product [Symbiodinium sp. CCMP2592]|nr:unnamed protein product [Symbiodinium sp. CCMP2592]